MGRKALRGGKGKGNGGEGKGNVKGKRRGRVNIAWRDL